MILAMKRVAALTLAVGMLPLGSGCTSSARRHPPLPHHSEFSTATRLWEDRVDIEHREKILQRKGLSAEEARQYSEIEYLRSRAGSPLR